MTCHRRAGSIGKISICRPIFDGFLRDVTVWVWVWVYTRSNAYQLYCFTSDGHDATPTGKLTRQTTVYDLVQHGVYDPCSAPQKEKEKKQKKGVQLTCRVEG